MRERAGGKMVKRRDSDSLLSVVIITTEDKAVSVPREGRAKYNSRSESGPHPSGVSFCWVSENVFPNAKKDRIRGIP